MDWGQMAVFLYTTALTHFFADLLSHRWKKVGTNKIDVSVLLHCLLYSVFFIPLFWWFDVNFWWLLFIFFSHLIIDRPARKYIVALATIFAKGEHRIVSFGLDQTCHLLAPLIIALFVFS